MTDPILQLDAELEWLGEIADELERQVAPCPVTRILLVAWLTEWVPTPRADSDEAGTASPPTSIEVGICSVDSRRWRSLILRPATTRHCPCAHDALCFHASYRASSG